MKPTFPLLYQMRQERDRRNAPLAEAFISVLRLRDQELRHARGTIRALEESKSSLQRAFLHPFAARLRDSMTDEIGKRLSKTILEAIIEARGKGSWDAEVTVPVNLMDHFNKDSILRYVTDYYLAHMEAEANVRRGPREGDSPISDVTFEVEHLEISIPTVACSRELVMMDPVAPSYTKGRR